MYQGGMTDMQYKGMLVEELDDWERIKRIAATGEASAELKSEIERQINKISRKLRLG